MEPRGGTQSPDQGSRGAVETLPNAAGRIELKPSFAISERIKSALDQKRSHGKLTGSVTFGWNAEPTGEINKNGKPTYRTVCNAAEQEWILQMLAWRSAGWTDWRIARELNARGVKTKRAGEMLTVVCAHDTPGARLNKRGNSYVVDKPASGLWQAEQVTTLLASQTVQTWLAQRKAG